MTKNSKGAKVKRYINRELSWIHFNERVLEEAENEGNPILERTKFLSIFESNLDEFFMVRVSGLVELSEGGITELSPDGLTPREQLQLISDRVHAIRRKANSCFENQILPKLAEEGIQFLAYESLSRSERTFAEEFFFKQVFPVCTPLMLEPAASKPFISNRSLNLLVDLSNGGETLILARIKVPTVIQRLIQLPGKKPRFIWLDDLITSHLASFFPGVPVRGSYLFRVIRDADIEVRELEAADLLASLEEQLKRRRFGDPVMLEVEKRTPKPLVTYLMKLLELDPLDVYPVSGRLGLESLLELDSVQGEKLRMPKHIPVSNPALSGTEKIFEAIGQTDILLHHPYDSFRPVVDFIGSAATDPQVIGVKQTLYRVGTESPIVNSLLDAAEVGKQVAAMVELKARFDERNNIVWARALERAGVHVTFGFPEMKTHCKLSLVVRKEGNRVASYAHIGTGNYNPMTARLYSDIGLFTADPDITQDISELFNYLTGYSRQEKYRKLLVAPTNLREGVLDLIHAEIASHKKFGHGRIALKLNALVDPEAIDALYEASNAGVKVDLVVRGVCCLRPNVPRLSENIRVISIVGRFLEHSRIYYFRNNGNPVVYIGSADLMRRNLDRRIEVMVPVEKPELKVLLAFVLDTCLKDNTQCWDLRANGSYFRRKPKPSCSFSSQEFFIRNPFVSKQF